MRRNSVMFSFREPRRYGKPSLVLAVALGIVAGFGSGYWLRGLTAERMAQDAARRARAELAAAVCADEFLDQHDANGALAGLVAVHGDARAELLVRQGWVTMPDRVLPEKAAARLCAARLGEAYTTVRRSQPIYSR